MSIFPSSKEVPAPEALADMRQRLGDLIHDGGEDPVEVEESLGKCGPNEIFWGFEWGFHEISCLFNGQLVNFESNGNITPIHFSWGYNGH